MRWRKKWLSPFLSGNAYFQQVDVSQIGQEPSVPAWFFYVDESFDKEKLCLSALAIRHSEWKQCFDEVRNHRRRLKEEYGIYLRKEVHARDFVAGRGRISGQQIGKWQRSRIFLGLLQLIARLPEVHLFNVCLNVSGNADPQMTAWDRLVNRIERTMTEFENREHKKRGEILASLRQHLSNEDFAYIDRRLRRYRSRAVIISDEGKEQQITRAIRKMHVFNPIPSRYGQWAAGKSSKNIVTERLIEDPAFKPSHRSYFIQLVDCVAFALLKRETTPTALVAKYGINEMFEQALSGVCFRAACKDDPLGIVRK